MSLRSEDHFTSLGSAGYITNFQARDISVQQIIRGGFHFKYLALKPLKPTTLSTKCSSLRRDEYRASLRSDVHLVIMHRWIYIKFLARDI